MAKRLAELVAAKIALDFPEEPGKKKLSQQKIARKIGTVQPVLSDILAAKGSVGVTALLVLREWLQKPIDEMLGLPPLPSQLKADLRRALEDIEAQKAAKKLGGGGLPPEPDTAPDKP